MPAFAATIVSPACQRREIMLHFQLSRAYAAADDQLALLGNANGHAQPCELVAGHQSHLRLLLTLGVRQTRMRVFDPELLCDQLVSVQAFPLSLGAFLGVQRRRRPGEPLLAP